MKVPNRATSSQTKDSTRLSAPLRRLIWVSVSGVFLDGYDISIIALALLQVKVQFHALPWQVGLIGSAVLVGNFLGALIFGRIADLVGRRAMFILNVVFFVVFALLSGLSTNITQLIHLAIFARYWHWRGLCAGLAHCR